MTLRYDMERLCVALGAAERAAGEVFAHDIPDWLRHRLAHIVGESIGLRMVLDEEVKP